MPHGTTERGFRIFDEGIKSKYGGTLRVQESSIAFEGAHVWIFMKDIECKEHFGEHLRPEPHLSVPSVKLLIRALQKFVDEAEDGQLTESAEPPTEDEWIND